MTEPVLLALAFAALGALLAAQSVVKVHRATADIWDFIEEVGDESPSRYHENLKRPFATRVVGGLGRGVLRRAERYLPGPYLAGIQRKLQMAGVSEKRRPMEQLAIQVVSGALLGLAGLSFVLTSQPGLAMALTAMGLVPAVGFLYPAARLSRKVNARAEAILEDLPDTLDLLAISVEAGVGFEGALGVVCSNFDSPLADEFETALREMQLGLSRREAFHNMRVRTEIPALSTFIMAIVQADALGIPVGRVLKTQAVEMRSQRRQWAREKAAKLPVKILVPLVLFIFPPVLIIVLGPAALTFTTLR